MTFSALIKVRQTQPRAQRGYFRKSLSFGPESLSRVGVKLYKLIAGFPAVRTSTTAEAAFKRGLNQMTNAYATLDEVTGVGKIVTNTNKYTGESFAVGPIEGEVSVSDGENKYVIQRIRLDGSKCKCTDDTTQYVYRVGYYTQRTDGRFCLGSQFAPILTPAEFRLLLHAVTEKGWLAE
jgi:hypothetical protein